MVAEPEGNKVFEIHAEDVPVVTIHLDTGKVDVHMAPDEASREFWRVLEKMRPSIDHEPNGKQNDGPADGVHILPSSSFAGAPDVSGFQWPEQDGSGFRAVQRSERIVEYRLDGKCVGMEWILPREMIAADIGCAWTLSPTDTPRSP